MKHLDKVAIIAVLFAMTGCASTSDLEAIGARVADLETKVASAEQHAADAHKVAVSAEQHASAAHAAADKAAQACADINSKLDRLFKKAQFK